MIIGTQNVRTCALMFIVLIYLMFGAAVFNALESKEEVAQRNELRAKMARILYKNATIQNETVFNSVTSIIFEHRHVRNGTTKQWTFPGAFYFSTLVVTLIGYGETTPKTSMTCLFLFVVSLSMLIISVFITKILEGGKIFCMVYTVAGVPLNLIMFQSVGERLNAIISFVLSRLKRLFGFRRHKVSGFELIAVEFGMTTMLVLGGSFIFCKQEKWTYFESIYYSLVTFWTIGFGDLVPLANLQRSGQSLYSRWGYFIFTISFILFGLAIMASSLNLLVLRLAQFHSENGIGGISDVLGRNEEDLIAAAIAEHRASISIQQRNRICSNASMMTPQQQQQQQKALPTFLPVKTCSLWSLSSSNSQFDYTKNPQEDTCCAGYSLITCKKRRRRHWHSRRSPQNIKHLIYFNQMLENHKLAFVRKSLIPNQYNNHMTNHISDANAQKQQRISI